jgi:hypothetical protein
MMNALFKWIGLMFLSSAFCVSVEQQIQDGAEIRQEYSCEDIRSAWTSGSVAVYFHT